MFHYSHLSPAAYTRHLRENLGSATDFGQERFTGFVIGRFFCITHHCDWEWNRKITSEMNTAVGIVKQAEAGCSPRYITLKGILRPQSFFLYLLLCLAYFWTATIGRAPIPFSVAFPVSLGIVTFVAIVNAIQVSVTERGKEGLRLLQNLLRHPENPYL